MARTTFTQRSTGQVVAIREQELADDGTYNYWLTDLDGNRLGDFYPYAAGPRMEANRRFGYVQADVVQSAGVCSLRGVWDDCAIQA